MSSFESIITFKSKYSRYKMKCNMRKNYDSYLSINILYRYSMYWCSIHKYNLTLFSKTVSLSVMFHLSTNNLYSVALFRSKIEARSVSSLTAETITKVYLFIRGYRRIFADGFGYRFAIGKSRRTIFVCIRSEWARKREGIRARGVFRARYARALLRFCVCMIEHRGCVKSLNLSVFARHGVQLGYRFVIQRRVSIDIVSINDCQ